LSEISITVDYILKGTRPRGQRISTTVFANRWRRL